MPSETFVIRLQTGQYFAGRVRSNPTSSPRIADADTYPSRFAALAECAEGPGPFFDRATIVPSGPQDAPAVLNASIPPPEPQDGPGGAPAAGGEGK
jgi:hypothetical protein